MVQKTNEKGILTCPFSAKGLLGNPANSTRTLTGLCGFFDSPFTVRHVKTSGHNSSIHLNHIKLSLAQHECVKSSIFSKPQPYIAVLLRTIIKDKF